MTKFIRYKKILVFSVLLLALSAQNNFAQKNLPKAKIRQIIKSANATVGVAILGLEAENILRLPFTFPTQLTMKRSATG